MLTLVQLQVNFFAMVDQQPIQIQDQAAQQALIARILHPLMVSRRPQRVLILNHKSASEVILSASASAEIVCLSNEVKPASAQLFARLDCLPFEDVTFELVVIQHLITDGAEKLMGEAIRVLAPGGDMVLSGLNHAGLRYHKRNQDKHYPGIKINRTIFHLNSNLFTIKRCLRSGFLGMRRPLAHEGWSGLSLPFTDRVVLHARHRSGGEAMRLSSLDRARSASISSLAPAGLKNWKSLS